MMSTKTNSNARTACATALLFFVAALLSPGSRAEPAEFVCELGQRIVKGDTPDGPGTWCEVDDKKNGHYQVFYPNGQVKIDSHFTDNLQDGSYQMKDSSGQLLREGRFSKGKMDQSWKRYYANGKLKDEGRWKDDSPEGLWKFYREDGKLEEQGSYENGVPVCVWKKYSIDGRVSKTEKAEPSSYSCGGFSRPRLSLHHFSAEALFGSQSSTSGGSNTFMLGYQPQGYLGESFDWVSGLSVGAFRSRSGGISLIPILDYSGGVRYYFTDSSNFFAELRIGLQTWMKVGTYFSRAIKVGYNPHWKNIIFYAAVENVYVTNNEVSETRFGIEFNLGGSP